MGGTGRAAARTLVDQLPTGIAGARCKCPVEVAEGGRAVRLVRRKLRAVSRGEVREDRRGHGTDRLAAVAAVRAATATAVAGISTARAGRHHDDDAEGPGVGAAGRRTIGRLGRLGRHGDPQHRPVRPAALQLQGTRSAAQRIDAALSNGDQHGGNDALVLLPLPCGLRRGADRRADVALEEHRAGARHQ